MIFHKQPYSLEDISVQIANISQLMKDRTTSTNQHRNKDELQRFDDAIAACQKTLAFMLKKNTKEEK